MKKILALGLAILGATAMTSMTSCIKKTAETVSAVDAQRGVLKPDDVVREFVVASAGVKSEADREKLQKLCAGEMRRTFERMTPEAFKLAYLSAPLKLMNYRVTDVEVKEDEAKISYQVQIDNPHGSDPTIETNQREVELTRTQGAWYIESIRPKGSDKIAFTRGMIF